MHNPSSQKSRARPCAPIVVVGLLLSALCLFGMAPKPPVLASVFEGVLNDGDPTPEISTAALRQALLEPNTVVLDARPYAEFAISHIPGARSVPAKAGASPSRYVADVAEVIRTVPDRQSRIILYCNGLHCGRSKRFGSELAKAGYPNVQRYQLGIPAWRALGGVCQVEKDALLSLLEADRTAVLVDARERPASPALRSARSIPLAEASAAKDDGRLPMTDHNTRIFVVGASAAQARSVAEAIVRDAFHNVAFLAGSTGDLPSLLVRAAQ
jgi:rhodanese-related sulfurtransferase